MGCPARAGMKSADIAQQNVSRHCFFLSCSLPIVQSLKGLGVAYMVYCVELAAILKDKDLVCQVLCHVVDWDFDFGTLRGVCLGDVEHFARWPDVCILVAAESRFVLAEPDVGE